MRRHRTKMLDGSVLLAIVAVGLFVAFEIDVFLTQGQVSAREQTLELDEVLLLGSVLCCGLLLFALRRNHEQKKETQRRQAAERQARELAMQDGLTGLPNRRQYDDALRAAIAAPPREGAAHAVFLLDLNGFAAATRWPAHVTVAVDLLPGQLRDHELGKHVTELLREGGLSPSRLEVEITESALVRDIEAAQDVLGALRAAGVRIVLDNFGTGYSNLYHLRHCRPDKIKIDRTFVDGMLCEQDSAAVVRALIGLGQGLGFTIAAEGIEDSQQQTSLLSTGCELGQGDLYSRALPAEQTALLFSTAGESDGTAAPPVPAALKCRA